ncbi:3,5-cyclic-nucleotide phosphodiesterase [Babesia ovis]|uniref:Phosphodiesterase n=1 Tax=Babesia ovis TaxID=5869 RepID=A0A9W5TDP5_BABOV|nr:3,5-cyclic-nucleotide phosphodiesterase [Babesia ovis]
MATSFRKSHADDTAWESASSSTQSEIEFKCPLEVGNIDDPDAFDSIVRDAVEKLPGTWRSIRRYYRPISPWGWWYSSEVASLGVFVKRAYDLSFKDPCLERLYVLNVNRLILEPMLYSNIAMIILTCLFWFCLSILVTSSGFEKELSGGIMAIFHGAMITTCVLLMTPALLLFKVFEPYAEGLCYMSYTIMVVIWGCWRHVLYHSIYDFNGNASDILVLKSMSSISLFIFGIGYIMIIDLFLHSRIRWAAYISLLQVFINLLGTITNAVMEPSFVLWVDGFLQVLINVVIVTCFYCTACHSELETRIQFLTWITRYVTSTRSGMMWRDKAQFSSTAERLYVGVRECKELLQDIHCDMQMSGIGNPEPVIKLRNALDKCMEQLRSGDSFYGLSYGGIDVREEQLEVIDAYLCCSKVRFSTQNTMARSSITTNLNLETRLSLSLPASSRDMLPADIPSFEPVDRKILESDWKFNVLKYFDTSDTAFMSIGHGLLYRYQQHCDIDKSTMVNFLSRIQMLYHDVPYHNKMHGAMVAQKLLCLCSYTGLMEHLTVLDEALLMVAALCHDVGHPGRNNAFFVRTHHPVAQLYNDTSVLENYHAACTLRILCTPGCNIFADCDYDYVRSQIIELILATDTVDQFHMISQFVLSCKSEDFTFEDYNNRMLTSKMLIKASDVSAPTMEWSQSTDWVSRLLCEFYAQGAEEVAYGIPISALCDRQHHDQAAKSQAAFLRIVVSPLYEAIASLGSPKIKDILHQLEQNAEKWVETDRNGTTVPCHECDETKVDLDVSLVLEPLLKIC